MMSGELESLLKQLRTPAVRDLAWVIGSPPLLDARFSAYQGKVAGNVFCQQALAACSENLLALDHNPAPLLQFITQQPTRRLGYYFETLVEYWLRQASGIELLAHNLPVRDAQRTIGEFDFLFRQQGIVIHWETAIKFYLQAAPGEQQHVFVGPGGYDRLDLKVDRIFQHQLQLSNAEANHQHVDAAQAFVKGMLFYPIDSQLTNAAGVAIDHLRGWWLRHCNNALKQFSPASRWIVLSRLRWLSPALLSHDAAVMKPEEVTAMLDLHFSKMNIALLLAEVQQDAAGYWQEVSRGFVVSAEWPVNMQ